jgi:hypothetical protein
MRSPRSSGSIREVDPKWGKKIWRPARARSQSAGQAPYRPRLPQRISSLGNRHGASATQKQASFLTFRISLIRPASRFLRKSRGFSRCGSLAAAAPSSRVVAEAKFHVKMATPSRCLRSASRCVASNFDLELCEPRSLGARAGKRSSRGEQRFPRGTWRVVGTRTGSCRERATRCPARRSHASTRRRGEGAQRSPNE